MPLLIAMDGYLPDVQGVGCHLSVQERRNSKALHIRDDGKAICDQSTMLFL